MRFRTQLALLGAFAAGFACTYLPRVLPTPVELSMEERAVTVHKNEDLTRKMGMFLKGAPLEEGAPPFLRQLGRIDLLDTPNRRAMESTLLDVARALDAGDGQTQRVLFLHWEEGGRLLRIPLVAEVAE